MTDAHDLGPIRFRDKEADKLVLSAGTGYGLLFGLSFALFVWGYDTLLLVSSAADLAWAKLLVGLPIAIIISGLIGRVAASSSTAASIALWATAGALLGLLAGRAPYDGGNLAAWLVDRRLRGLVAFPYGSSAAARTALMVLVGAGLGTASGGLEQLAMGWAWDWSTPEGRMSVRSWLALLVCLPLTLVAAWAADDLVNRSLRVPQQTMGELINLTLAGASEEAEARELNYASTVKYRQRFSEHYTVHLADYDLDTLYMSRVDVAFDNGFALRCLLTADGGVGFCGPISDAYRGWMDDLVHAGLSGERRWLGPAKSMLAVDDTVVAWLDVHRGYLSETNDVTRVDQRGRWVFMSARFDTGFEMVCRFRGVGPVLTDQCAED